MTNHNNHTALVTGATSGLGFEAAVQLAEAGYSKVIISGRDAERAAKAAAQLAERAGRDVFESITIDLGVPDSVSAAAVELINRSDTIDLLLLNAGMVSGNDLVRTDEGVEITFASSLIGHHQLTMQLLGANRLAPTADIVIAGSEAARGDVPTFKVADLKDLAAESFDGDLEAAAEALIRQDGPVTYKAASAYADTKLSVAWWAASLARRLPDGMAVNAVSPGSAPDTMASRNATGFMKHVLLPFFKHAPSFLGMSQPVSVAAARYLEVADYDNGVTGQFFASAPKKMIGPIEAMRHDHFKDEVSQEAAWTATVKVAGGIDAPVG